MTLTRKVRRLDGARERALEIRDLRSLDWPEVAAIYEDGIRTRQRDVRDRRAVVGRTGTRRTRSCGSSRSSTAAPPAGRRSRPYSDRCCYAGVAEDSVYVASWAQGRGVGRGLLDELIARSEAAGIWTLQAGIFPRTRRAFACISAAASGSSARASASAS